MAPRASVPTTGNLVCKPERLADLGVRAARRPLGAGGLEGRESYGIADPCFRVRFR